MTPVIKPYDDKILKQLKETYFNSPDRLIKLKKGELLLEKDQLNTRLFMVLSGELVGYLSSSTGVEEELFRSETGMFVGVHSFFSKGYKSYAKVVAEQETELAYIDDQDFSEEERHRIAADFVPILVKEISSRQRLSQKVHQEKEEALKELLHAEKMATLGQMAAGLAHELNNAIGVLQGNTEWLSKEMSAHFKETETANAVKFYEYGLTKGQDISSKEARRKRKKLERKFGLSTSIAKRLAKIGIDADQLFPTTDVADLNLQAQKYYRIWEFGVAVHDIMLSSRHARHVLNSVKQLAVASHDRVAVDVNETILESLTLLKSMIRRVQVKHDLNNLPTIEGNQGELVQIWVNIIKNACESMLSNEMASPILSVQSKVENKHIIVNIGDNGPGIPLELQSKIFHPNVTTKKDGLSFGLGLGLSIVQRLVESYQGKINVDSKKGKTVFKIQIPIKTEHGKN